LLLIYHEWLPPPGALGCERSTMSFLLLFSWRINLRINTYFLIVFRICLLLNRFAA
jgi:hypothetical protein